MVTKILITGITGMVGSHLADFLLQEEPTFQLFGTKRSRSPLVNIAHIHDRLNLVDCNLMDATAVLNLIESVQPDYVFHLAAHSFVPDSWRAPHVTLIENISMQLNLFEAIRHTKLDPIVQVALSSEQYGRQPDDVPLNENSPFRPLSPYAVSKVTQDMLAYQYHQSYGLKVIRTRSFNHDGPRRTEVFATSNFAKQIAEIETGLKPPILYVGNLKAKRDFSDVRDVVRAYWLAVKHGTAGEDYVICSGKSRSIQEMLDYLLSLSSAKIEVRVDPARQRPSDVMHLRGDASKFKRLTGWEPRYSFEQTMSDLLEWWRAQVRKRETSKVST